MCLTMRRFIAVYSPSTASVETQQQTSLFVLPEQEFGEYISLPTFLGQLALARRTFPIGYSLAYLRYIHTQPNYFRFLLEWLRRQMQPSTLNAHQQTAISLTCLYLLLYQGQKASCQQALAVYGFKNSPSQPVESGVDWVVLLNQHLETQLTLFFDKLSESTRA
ncbi:hypothetical protein [Vibrio ziniensis]|uniref:Uncharacterized protein n=1 Tax=Vibrio ziniensis TaxID=2711221 RepID=A0A6G7CLQ8_9VIBR|nr:hypothetical protein [Vibrio ziniensis]QIH42983.1 hypothetical protein G5S32_13965 [Vibrio ziniensis]